jgi:acyl-CoA synthetase (AMP-forming)/AMP-acid ligase II
MPGPLREALKADYGRRLVPTIIDQLAASDPDRNFASYPKSSDLTEGFIDVSFSTLSNAINRASWWLAAAMKSTASSDTFAYLGPNDLRYPILLVAAIKCGYKVRGETRWPPIYGLMK